MVRTIKGNPAGADIGSTRERPADGMVMVYVPAGEFRMGMDAGDAWEVCTMFRSDCDRSWFTSEEPVHTVYLDAYWIDSTEVTNAMYALCVAAGGCNPPVDPSSFTRSLYYGNPAFVDYPVVHVSWSDAESYCAWAGAQLPTEAQWEKAARGEDGRMYPWGDAAPACILANFWGQEGGCIGDPDRVGTYPAGVSPYGAFDLAGNVWEWVADWYARDYYEISPSSNPGGPSSGTYRVLRGGSWVNFQHILRVASRNGSDPDVTYNSIGFRCSRSP